jgi:hypothetical protein
MDHNLDVLAPGLIPGAIDRCALSVVDTSGTLRSLFTGRPSVGMGYNMNITFRHG